MAIEKMLLVNVLGKLDTMDTAFERVCIDEDFHPESTLTFLEDSKGYASISQDNPYTPMLQALDELSKSHAPPLKLTPVTSPVKYDREGLGQFVDHVSDEFKTLDRQFRALKEDISMGETFIAQLSHFTGLNVRLDEVFSCEFIKVRFGRIPRDSYPKLQAYEDNPYVMFFPGSVDTTHYWGVYFCPREQVEEVDRIFSHLYFERLRVPGVNGTPEEGIERFQKKVATDRKRLSQLTQKIQTSWEKQHDKIEKAYSFLTYLSDAFDLRRYAAKHGALFHLIGWIPASKQEEFFHRFDDMEAVQVVFEPPDDAPRDVTPPIRLKNKWLARPFEMFVDMFGLPDYDEVDPTVFISITYCILFGIMFADVGQGILLFLVGLYMYKKQHMSIGPILVRTSIFSTLFGCIFGSVFGFETALDSIYASFGLSPFRVMEPENITLILLASIAIGCVLNMVAMVINIFSGLRRKRYADALFGPNGAAGLVFYASILAAGALLFATGLNLFSLPYILLLIVLPLLVMFFREPLGNLVGRKPKIFEDSVGEFISGNFFELFDFLLSYLSNTLSFLRVGAFVLVHAGMMKVVFVIAELFDPVGYTIAVVIGNGIVACLEALLVAIQVLRLEYYEMFSRFYSGNGKPFLSIRSRKTESQ